jgi:hypothetical protein
MSKATIRRIINRLLTDSKIDKISPKYLNLTDHELSYHKSRILNEGEQHYDRLKFMLRDNNYMLKYTDKEISDIFNRSHLDVYGYNKDDKKQYILRDKDRAMISSYMFWVLMGIGAEAGPNMFLYGTPISLSLGYVYYRLELNSLNKTIDDYSYALSYTLKKKERLQ